MAFPSQIIQIHIKFQPFKAHLKSINYGKWINSQVASVSPSQSENISFSWRSILVICITSCSSIVFPVQGTFIAILPVHPLPGKENILHTCNLKTKSIHYLFKWKNCIHYVHPKTADSQPFQTSIKSHCHWKERFPNISHFLSRAGIHRQALKEISNKSICQSALGKGSFPHQFHWNFAFSLPGSQTPHLWLLPITHLPY